MNTMDQTVQEQITRRDAFLERLIKSASGFFDIFSIYIGDRLNLYETLAGQGPLTSTMLSTHTGTHERYVREWLEQQTVAGILEVEDEGLPGNVRRYRIPSGHSEVLVDRESLNYLAPIGQLLVGTVHPLPLLLNAFRKGGGVPYKEYGPDMREGEARFNRATYMQLIGNEWLPAIPDVHRRLQGEPPARVADIGCGAGWSCIGIANSYPKVIVDGYDLDEPSIELARRNVSEAGLSDRINIHIRDASDFQLTGQYDLVTAFECLHDMSDPVGALKTMGNLAGENGAIVIVDERVSDNFTAKGNDIEWMMYGLSVLHCLAVCMADQPSAATGTVMRLDTLKKYAQEAGFRDVEVLPINHFFWRFYRLGR